MATTWFRFLFFFSSTSRSCLLDLYTVDEVFLCLFVFIVDNGTSNSSHFFEYTLCSVCLSQVMIVYYWSIFVDSELIMMRCVLFGGFILFGTFGEWL